MTAVPIEHVSVPPGTPTRRTARTPAAPASVAAPPPPPPPPTTTTTTTTTTSQTSSSSRKGWKCGVCGTKAGDLVCSGCVQREAERRRDIRVHRLRALKAVRDAAALAVQRRRRALEQESQLQKEAAEESRLKEDIRQVTQRVAEERIQVASAAFSLRHQRDVLAAAESHLAREQTSAAELKAALLEGLRQHVEDATETLRQRRWRKVVRIFVLLQLQPSPLPFADTGRAGRQAGVAGALKASAGAGPEGRHGDPGKKVVDSGEVPGGNRSSVAAVVRGVSTVLDIPLPNNGDYTHVPADIVMAGLSLVARLVVSVARCLAVSLPHPLSPAASMSYATVAVDSSPKERSNQYPLCPLSKLAEIGVMGGASSVINTVGAFETALDLLRSDVVHLCVEGARVPVDRLWPAEALLLNLWELQQHAMSELRRSSSMVDVPLPLPRELPSDFNTRVKRASSATGHPSSTGSGAMHRPHPDVTRAGFSTASREGVSRGAGGRIGARDTINGSAGWAARGAEMLGSEGGGATRAFGERPADEESTYEFILDDGAAGGLDEVQGGSVNLGLAGSRYAERMRSWGSRLAAATGSAGAGLR